MAASKGTKQGHRRHNDGDGRQDDSKGWHDDGKKGQQGNGRHDDGKGQQGDGDGWHDDGKGQQGVRRHDKMGNVERRRRTMRASPPHGGESDGNAYKEGDGGGEMCVFSFVLAVTEVNEFLAYRFFCRPDPVPTLQQFQHKLAWELIKNKWLAKEDLD